MKYSKIVFLLFFSKVLFAQQSEIDPLVIQNTFPELNEIQRSELLNSMNNIHQQLAQNFKTMQLKPLICKGDIHYSKIHCLSKNYEDRMKKEFNHYSGQKIKYGYGFSVILIHQIKPKDIPLQASKPKFLIEQVYWNDTIDSNQYQGNEIITLGDKK